MKKRFHIRHILPYLRKQPPHMQHMYALAISGVITAFLGFVILYADYGFFRERYYRGEEVLTEEIQAPIESKSPFEMVSIFFGEAKDKLKTLEESGTELLEGKEVYIRGEQDSTSTER